VVRLIAGQAARLIGIGALAGVAVAFALSRIVRASGGAGTIYDPAFVSFVVPVLILAVVGLLASWLPARRALRINPAAVLRTS
jgi:ABC-type antimicrobial peptide transport system permease subunit